jgi:hypothetical protein
VVFNATFKNISVVSWQSILLVEETEIPGKKTTDKLYHIMFYWTYPLKTQHLKIVEKKQSLFSDNEDNQLIFKYYIAKSCLEIVIHTIQYKIYNIIQTHRHFGSFPKTTSTDFMVEKPNYNSIIESELSIRPRDYQIV